MKTTNPKQNAIDLHVHSNASDGTYTPSELVSYAIEKKLSAIALTDHDTVDGIKEAIKAAEGKNIEIIPGIELSTNYHGTDLHILGLNIDYDNPTFIQQLDYFQKARELRNEKMALLLREHGFDISLSQLQTDFPDAVMTRAHFAKYLFNHGFVKDMREVFDKYIGDTGPCFVPRYKITPIQAISFITSANGIPILAHPLLYHLPPKELELLIAELKDAGLKAIEALYAAHSPSDERTLKQLAKKYHLKISGGSDFHGSNKPTLELGTGYGNLYIPYSVLEILLT